MKHFGCTRLLHILADMGLAWVRNVQVWKLRMRNVQVWKLRMRKVWNLRNFS